MATPLQQIYGLRDPMAGPGRLDSITGQRIEYSDSIDIWGTPVPSPTSPSSPSNPADSAVNTEPILSRQDSALENNFDSIARDLEGNTMSEEARQIQGLSSEVASNNQDLRNLRRSTAMLDAVSKYANAQNKYSALKKANELNIMSAKMAANEARAKGAQQGLYARSEGVQAGESAALAMAVQGQDVNAAATDKLEASYETIGIYNGLQAEIDGLREALGYELKAWGYQQEIEAARNQRNLTTLAAIGEAGMAFR